MAYECEIFFLKDPVKKFISNKFPVVQSTKLLNTGIFIRTLPKFSKRLAGLNVIFLSPDRLSGRNGVTSVKVNFRPDIRQNVFFEKYQGIKSSSKQIGVS